MWMASLSPLDRYVKVLLRLNELVKVTDAGGLRTNIPGAISKAHCASSLNGEASPWAGGVHFRQWGELPQEHKGSRPEDIYYTARQEQASKGVE